MKLYEVMKRPVVSVPSDYSVSRAAQVMGDTGFGFLAVVDRGAVVGVLTGKDLAIRAAAKKVSLDTTVVAGIMSHPPIWLNDGADVEDAIVVMRKHSIRRVLVTDAVGDVVGVVGMSDLEGNVADEAIERALERHAPVPSHRIEPDPFGIPGLYLG